MNAPFEWIFVIYKFGPYSFDLAHLIGEIHSCRLVELMLQWWFQPKIKVMRYGKDFYEDINELCYKYRKQIEFVKEELGSQNLSEIELLATGLYIISYEKVHDKTVENRSRILNHLKSHIKLNDASTFIGEVDSLIERAQTAQSKM